MTDEEMIAGGFRFLSAEDAEKARVDEQKIDYIRQHVNLESLEAIRAVYEKAITNRVFKTPVGWSFLSELREQMLAMGEAEENISAVPVQVSFSRGPVPGDYVTKQRIKPAPVKKKKEFPVQTLLITIIVALSAMLVALFIIAKTSDVDNILNYKQNITNRYASWEQELTEREKAVREKEKALESSADAAADQTMDTSGEALAD